MKPVLFALLTGFAALTALPAAASIPTITLPDLTFPTPEPDISTQGCGKSGQRVLCP